LFYVAQHTFLNYHKMCLMLRKYKW